MLKIKDNIELEDIKEITEFTIDDDYIWIGEEEPICIDRFTKIITVYSDYEEGNKDLDILYDLIETDVVEKVEQ